MPFFDNLSKKASEATAKAMQKAQDFSETSRLNSMIAEQEKRINTTYYQIGKLYVSVHGADREEAFVGMVSDIADAEQKIAEYRKQIQDIKGVQHCDKCGAEVPSGVAFCSSCGAPMPKPEVTMDSDSVKCENCGAMVKRGMRFCTSCGKPMAATVISSPAEEFATEKKKTCPSCGAEITEDVAFCTECGAKL